MASSDDIPILDRPYSDRQLIIVNDLAAEAARRSNRSEDGWSASSPKRKRVVGTLQTVLAITVWPMNAQLVSDLLNAATRAALKAWGKARDSGLEILPIGKEAAQAIIFPPGHPRTDVLYIGHPTLPKLYYPMADFHRITFEHKFCEAIHLLMSLGATHIEVEHIAGWSKDFSARLSVPIPDAIGDIGGEVNRASSAQHALLYEADFAGTDRPTVPEGLVWYPHEPTWQSVAKGRTEFGLSKFAMTVVYEDDFGINAGLRAKTQAFGLQLGGNFQDHQATRWQLRGSFDPPSREKPAT